MTKVFCTTLVMCLSTLRQHAKLHITTGTCKNGASGSGTGDRGAHPCSLRNGTPGRRSTTAWSSWGWSSRRPWSSGRPVWYTASAQKGEKAPMPSAERLEGPVTARELVARYAGQISSRLFLRRPCCQTWQHVWKRSRACSLVRISSLEEYIEVHH